jgi:hypothetical protein
MKKGMIITNNPKFKILDEANLTVEYHNISAEQIIKLVRNYVHNNYRILTHPLHSSLKPNETLYRSIVITNNAEPKLDFESIDLIEKASATYIRFLRGKQVEMRDEQILKDYQIIDYDLILKAME